LWDTSLGWLWTSVLLLISVFDVCHLIGPHMSCFCSFLVTLSNINLPPNKGSVFDSGLNWLWVAFTEQCWVFHVLLSLHNHAVRWAVPLFWAVWYSF
jgi:hypothetical protein